MIISLKASCSKNSIILRVFIDDLRVGKLGMSGSAYEKFKSMFLTAAAANPDLQIHINEKGDFFYRTPEYLGAKSRPTTKPVVKRTLKDFQDMSLIEGIFGKSQYSNDDYDDFD